VSSLVLNPVEYCKVILGPLNSASQNVIIETAIAIDERARGRVAGKSIERHLSPDLVYILTEKKVWVGWIKF
jgi:hypothetical protein